MHITLSLKRMNPFIPLHHVPFMHTVSPLHPSSPSLTSYYPCPSNPATLSSFTPPYPFLSLIPISFIFLCTWKSHAHGHLHLVPFSILTYSLIFHTHFSLYPFSLFSISFPPTFAWPYTATLTHLTNPMLVSPIPSCWNMCP